MSMPRMLRITAVATLLLSFSYPAAAGAISPPYQAWREGPVQWIMTSQEKRDWKKIDSDTAASRFIDLFWARRDPSVGTPQNEALDEFDARVKFADEHFAEGKIRGALSDRGRVLIVLGFASNQQGGAQWNTSQIRSGGADTGFDPTGGRDLGARETWAWTREEALVKFGIPKVEVVFIRDPIKQLTKRDPQRGDFYAAEDAAMKRSLISPDMKSVPPWALYGGLEQLIPQLTATSETAAEAPAATPAPTSRRSQTAPAPYVPPKISVATGVSRLTFTRDVTSINTQGTSDPFKAIKASGVFHSSDTLGWALQYCTSADETPVARFTLRITGHNAGRNVERAAPEDEMMLERVKILPGCYLLRGEVPLTELDPGTYQLQIDLQDVDSQKKFRTAGEFRVE